MIDFQTPKAGCLAAPVLLLLAGIFFVVGLIIHQDTSQFLQRAARAEGEVIELRQTRDSDGDLLYQPVIAFVTQNGERVVTEAGSASNPPSQRVGDRVALYYDPASPDQIRLDSFSDLWLLPTIFIALGALFGLG
ncbi:MAG: DUF3592 domain-containing protein, partial [Thermoflexales bacterium]|nr:DUF3592 domain-containing protein [Thermoflexales bacterium]